MSGNIRILVSPVGGTARSVECEPSDLERTLLQIKQSSPNAHVRIADDGRPRRVNAARRWKIA